MAGMVGLTLNWNAELGTLLFQTFNISAEQTLNRYPYFIERDRQTTIKKERKIFSKI
jgi:hypothetical protein